MSDHLLIRRLVLCACSCACACAVCMPAGVAWGAPPSSTAEQAVQKTILPPQLLQQVALTYPTEALATQEHGDVRVLVDVDHAGRVVAARFESGPEVFREAALDAAQRLVFSPATRDGDPVAATTRVRFHFAPPTEAPGQDESVVEVVVHGTHPDLEDTRARTTLSETELERGAADNLAENIAVVAGVTLASGTADAAKPIIRGQPERRLLVLHNGVRHESQKWGPDHATEIDPFSAGSISVIRGAAGARYGPDAIGGVILVEPPPLRTDPGIGGKALAAYSTNGRQPYGALRLDAAPAAVEGLSFRIEGNANVSATQVAPDYLLGNTASRTWNLGATAGYQWDHGQVRVGWHRHDFRAGVFYGVRNSNPADFQAQLEVDRPVTADLWEVTYGIDRPFQDVTHDVAMLDVHLSGSWGSLETTYAYQINLRREFEQARESIRGAQYNFTLRTHSLDVLYQHPELSTQAGRFTGGIGLQGTFQENVYDGLVLIPNYRGFGGGIFAYERLSLARMDFELGARLDGLARAAFLRENEYEAHLRRDTLDPAMCTEGSVTNRCPADYDTGSVSLGGLFHVVPEHVDLKVDLSTASRFPNVDELYLLGAAPSFPVYANGFPNLGVETAWGGSFTAGLRLNAIEAEVSSYGQYVDDYIYFAPDLNDNGEPRFDVTIRGTYPAYAYQAINAVFYGVDGSLRLGPQAPVGLDARGAMVRAQDAASQAHLIGTPADRLHLALVGRRTRLGPFDNVELRVTTDLVATQSRVELSADFAPPPPGYTLLGASLEAQVGRARLGISARNLLNTPYREYTSLLRYYADQPGRDVRVRVGVDF